MKHHLDHSKKKQEVINEKCEDLYGMTYAVIY